MWKNMGASLSTIPSVNPDSAFIWLDKGFVAPGGVYRGSAVEFGNIYGIGRADYVGKALPSLQGHKAKVWPSSNAPRTLRYHSSD